MSYIYQVVFPGKFNKLGFEAIRQLLIALKPQRRLSGARLVIRYIINIPIVKSAKNLEVANLFPNRNRKLN